MRLGTLWRVAVLASLALLVSGQLCMLTTCVPRLTSHSRAAHTCCRALPADHAPAHAPEPLGAMPCHVSLVTADAPTLPPPLANVVHVLRVESLAALLPAPAAGTSQPAPHDTGPPLARHLPAPTGLRAPPEA